MTSHCQFYNYKYQYIVKLSFKIIRKNWCGLDVHKTWIFACIGIADIRQLRDLVRYRFKLTCMITGEKNRAHNCLTVSNLKLDDVFSDIFGKSARSITDQILKHPGEYFDVAPFVHSKCRTPIEEIQAAVDGAISPQQAVKLRQCLDHIDELEKHKAELEREIFRLSDKYEAALNLIRTVPGFDKNPLTAIQVLSEIGADMSVFPYSQTPCFLGRMLSPQ